MIAGIDIGATNIKAVVLDQGYALVDKFQGPTKDDGKTKSWMAEVKNMVDTVVKNYPDLSCMGLSAPGIPDEGNTCISFMPGRLYGLEGLVWSQYLGIPSCVLNDANASMVAESRIGAAKGYEHAIMLTLGTGVGGSILIHGKLYTGFRQVGGHLGHLSIDMHNSFRSITGMPGSLEDAIGDSTVKARTGGRYASTTELVNAVREGEEEAQKVWLESVRALAIAVAGLANVLSPQALVLGGGIASAGNLLMEPFLRFLDEYEWRPGGKKMEIKTARLGPFAGATGAGIFASEYFKS